MHDSSTSPADPNSLDIFPLFKSARPPSEDNKQTPIVETKDDSKETVETEKPKRIKQPRKTDASESNPFHCAICFTAVSSRMVYEEHIKGRRHQTQLQEILLKDPAYKTPTFEELFAKNQSKQTVQTPSERAKRTLITSDEFACDLCRVRCDCKRKFDLHIAGKKHQMNLREQAFAPVDRSASSSSLYACNVCSHRYNTARELQQHRLKSHSLRKNNEADRCAEAERRKQINFDDYRISIGDSNSSRFQYECKVCQRKFREKIYVLGHITSAYHIEQISRVQKKPLLPIPENDEILPDLNSNPFFNSKKRSYSPDHTYYPPISNSATDSYDQIPPKRSRTYHNPDYSNSHEDMPTDYPWNNNQYSSTQSGSYHNPPSWQYQSGSYYNQTPHSDSLPYYNQPNQMPGARTFLPNYDAFPSSYPTYPY